MGYAVLKELSKIILCFHPVLPVDAVFHLGCFYLSLNKPGIFQFFQMLRYSSFGNGQLIVYIAEIATVHRCQKVQDRDACRMPHRLGKPCQLFVVDGVIFVFYFFHDISDVCSLFANVRTISVEIAIFCISFVFNYENILLER